MSKTYSAALAALVSISVTLAAQAPRMPAPPMMPQQPSTAPAAQGTAVVSGRVVSADGRNGIRRALVRLSSPERPGLMTTYTDERGGFAFTQVPAGRFGLTATKPGYLEARHGQRRPGTNSLGTPLQVAQGARIEQLTLMMPRGAVLTGTIIDEAGEPAFGTVVRAMRFTMQNGERTPAPAGMATVDDRGVFRIPALVPGDYLVVASAAQDSSNGMFFAAGGNFIRSVAITAPMGMAGANMAMPMPLPIPAIEPPADETSGYAPVYYPGTPVSGSAQILSLGVGEERAGVDMQLSLVRLGRVTGTVMGDSGPAQGAFVQLLDTAQTLPGLGMRSAMTGPDGTFSFSGVPPGQYLVTARGAMVALRFAAAQSANGGLNRFEIGATHEPAVTGVTPQRPQWASADVTVAGGDAPQVALALRHGMTVSGRLVFDGSAPPTDLSQTLVQLTPARPNQVGGMMSHVMPARLSPDGQFQIPDMMPGEYQLMAVGAGPWRLRSVEIAGQEVVGAIDVKAGEDLAGIVATLTDRSTSLSGTLSDASGAPTADFTIIVASSDRRYWVPHTRRIQATRPATDGRFSFQDLPPGDYRLLAVTDVDDGQWLDPAFLERVIGASIEVSLGDGEKKTQDVRLR